MTSEEEYSEEQKIIKKEEFLCLNIYDALRVELKAKDVHIFMECVMIGKMLYTMAFLIWDDNSPSVLMVKNRFFNSFGKELKVE